MRKLNRAAIMRDHAERLASSLCRYIRNEGQAAILRGEYMQIAEGLVRLSRMTLTGLSRADYHRLEGEVLDAVGAAVAAGRSVKSFRLGAVLVSSVEAADRKRRLYPRG